MFLNYKFRRVIARFIPAATILAASFLSYPASAHAANFVHHHSESCLGRVEKMCTDHSIYYEEIGYKLGLCNNCQMYSTSVVTVYTEICNKGLVGPMEFRSQTCPNCKHEMQFGIITEPSAHVYYEDGYVCGYSDGEIVGSVRLSKSTSEWTNQDVTLNASVASMAAGFDSAQVTYDFGNGASGKSSYVVSTNGTYSVVANCPGYGSISDIVVVDNIDKNAPKISISKSTDKWTEAGVDIYINASDDESGLAEAAYSFNGGAYGFSSSIHVGSNGTVSVKVIDKAGNVSTGSIVISNIGKDPAVIEAERLEAERKEAERLEKERLEAIKKAEEEKKKQELLNSINKKEETTKPNKKDDVPSTKPDGAGNNSVVESGNFESTKNPETESTTHKNPLGNFIASFTGTNKNDSLERDALADNETKSSKNFVSVSKKTSTDKNASSLENEVKDSTVSHYIKLDVSSQKLKADDELKGIEESKTTEVDEALTLEKEYENISATDADNGGSVYAYIVAGVMVLLLGLMLVSHFNYIYYRKDGKIKVVSAARAKVDGKRIIVTINDKKLTVGGKFFICLSPWMKLSRKKKHVYVQIKNQDILIGTDESLCFSY